jgi:hypothetical protein
MPLLADIEEFVHDHCPHGPMTADATEEPAWNGYRLTVACSCGVVFERWVTSEEADRDLTSWSAIEVSRNQATFGRLTDCLPGLYPPS